VAKKVNEIDHFPLQPGDSMKRQALQKLIGGSTQSGMTSCLNGTEFLLFHDRKVSKEFGYDKWENWQANGIFTYTGQGVKGDQKMRLGNQGLVRAHEADKPIRLIESANTIATYIGQFVLSEPYYEIKPALDQDKKLRNVFVFNLLPVSDAHLLTAPDGHAFSNDYNLASWVAPNDSLLEKEFAKQLFSHIERLEHKLQGEFGRFLVANGELVQNIAFSIADQSGVLKPDFWLPERNLVVEAKVSTGREFVRLAIGQAFDYQNQAMLNGLDPGAAILLPGYPAPDLVELIKNLGITLIIRKSETEFIFESEF
jgi:hypothetical protein